MSADFSLSLSFTIFAPGYVGRPRVRAAEGLVGVYMNAAEGSVDLNFLLLAVGAFVHLHSAPGNSRGQSEAGQQAARQADQIGLRVRVEMRAGFRADMGAGFCVGFCVGFCAKSNVGFGAMAIALCARYTPWAAKMFRKRRE